MPKRTIIRILLPALQPDCCAECPLLGLVPKKMLPRYSKETHVCLGCMEAMSFAATQIRASTRPAGRPLHRPCDLRWHAWQQLPDRRLGVSVQAFNACRIPYEEGLQLRIKFHGFTATHTPATSTDTPDTATK